MPNTIGLGSILMLAAVAIGAFGAHGLQDRLQEVDARATDWYHTATLYMFVHALGILILGLLKELKRSKVIRAIDFCSWCFFLGIIFFSGSLFAMAVSGARSLGMITPLGGILFLLGWAQFFRVGMNLKQ